MIAPWAVKDAGELDGVRRGVLLRDLQALSTRRFRDTRRPRFEPATARSAP
jgi:hypothetical protein